MGVKLPGKNPGGKEVDPRNYARRNSVDKSTGHTGTLPPHSSGGNFNVFIEKGKKKRFIMCTHKSTLLGSGILFKISFNVQ